MNAGSVSLSDLAAMGEQDEWHIAGKLFTQGDSRKLEKMLKSATPIPKSIRSLLAEIVSGTLKIDRRGKENAVLTYDEKYKIWQTVRAFRSLLKLDLEKMTADMVAAPDLYYLDASDVRKMLRQWNADLIARFAAEYRVGKSLVRKTAKEFKPDTFQAKNKTGR